MSDFDDAAADAVEGMLDTFGEPVTLMVAGSPEVVAVFVRPYEDTSLGGLPYVSPDPLLEIPTDDIDGLGVVAGTSVVIAGNTYRVLSVEPDDVGAWTRLPVRRYS